MRRREFIALLATAAVARPHAAHAQQARLRLVGVLMGFSESRITWALVDEFRGALANAGWKEGGNLRIELRWGGGDVGRIGAAARELVALRPDAILAQTTPVATALARETHAIPIVFVTVSDPIGSGLAASLAHPGGNVTGFTFVESSMGSKMGRVVEENSATHRARSAVVQSGHGAAAQILFTFNRGGRVILLH